MPGLFLPGRRGRPRKGWCLMEADNRVMFFDTTLRDGEQTAGVNLNVDEKMQIALQLAKLKVDVIEAGFPAASPGDFECVNNVARAVSEVRVAALARTREQDIRACAEALAPAGRPRIHVFMATSPLHMQYKLKMSPNDVLKAVAKGVALSRRLVPEVEFSAEDASRSDIEFLARVFRCAVDNGATILNIPDTVGYATPDFFGRFVGRVIEKVKAPQNVIFSVHCHDDLGLATANSLAAVKNGARQVEGTINGLGERAGNAALEEVMMALKTRADFYGLTIGTDTAKLTPTSRLVARLTGVDVPPNKAIVGSNAFAHESGIHQHGVMANRETYEIMKAEDVGAMAAVLVLGKHSGRHAFKGRLEMLGYQLTEAQLEQAFERFKRLCDHKKDVTDGDLEALVADEILAVSPENKFEIKDYAVQSMMGLSTATVTLICHGREIRDAATGNGPVDSACQAIKRIIGLEPLLESYNLKAASQLSDALGEAVLVLSLPEHNLKAAGRGASTDVIEASIRAYVNAVNRLYLLAAARDLKLNGKLNGAPPVRSGPGGGTNGREPAPRGA